MAYWVIFFLIALFPLPWIWIAHDKPLQQTLAADWIDSIAVGFAAGLCLLYLCSLYSLHLFYWISLINLMAGIGILTVNFGLGTGTRLSLGYNSRILIVLGTVYMPRAVESCSLPIECCRTLTAGG